MNKISFIFVAAFSLFGAIYAAPGDLDTSFDGDGKVTYQFLNHTYRANDMALQPDGKIVLAGMDGFAFADFAIVRFNADGSLDGSFGNGGRVVTPVTANDDEALAVAIQPDGKIIAAGYAQTNPVNSSFVDFAIVRYHPNGTLDTSFDGDGIFITSFDRNDLAYAVAIQPDSKILASCLSQNEDFSQTTAVMLRLNADGTLDTTFDADGKLYFSVSGFDTFIDINVQPDAKIVVSGVSGGEGALLGRFNADGSLDTTFDGDGRAVFIANVQFTETVTQNDGKIVAVGYTTGQNFPVIARFNPNGSLDNGFSNGGDGFEIVPLPGEQSTEFNSVALQTNGKIIAVGGTNDFHIARFNTDGTLDYSLWGTGGIVTTDFSSGSSDSPQAVKIQANGKIVAAGWSNSSFAAARYLGDFAPTAANVSVSGQVLNSDKQGISRVAVSLTDSSGSTRYAVTNSFGNYMFEAIPAGQTYVISVNHKKYVFTPDSLVLNISEDLSGIDFTAIE
jgi:uncharacterized delta-60 repeat protein